MKRMHKEKYLDYVEDKIEDVMGEEPGMKSVEQLAMLFTVRDCLEGSSGGSGSRGRSQRRSREWDDEDDDYGRGGRDRSFRR